MHMLDSFTYSFNIIAPIFIIVFLGAWLRKKHFVNDEFLSVCDKLVFKICLPCLLFLNIADTNISESLNFKLIIFCIVAVTLTAFIPCLFMPLFIRDKAKCGAFIQGSFRSNAAILGVTLAQSMFADAGVSAIAMVLPFIVVIFNVYAVIILTIFAPVDSKLSPRELIRHIIKAVLTNPLIIAIVFALLWQLVPMKLPSVADISLSYLADIAMPISLISLGASIDLASLKGRIGLAIASSVCKTVFVPALAIGAAIIIGLRNVELGVVFIVFGGPAAVSSYIMAKQMKSDYELAAQILLISTLMCILTLFLGIFILKETGLI